MGEKLKILYLEHAFYPYRFYIFESLSKLFTVNVYYCTVKKFRKWNVKSTSNVTFKYKFLKGFKIGKFVINWELILILLKNQFDVYVIGVIDSISIFQVFLILIIAKVRKKPVILIEEFFETPWYRNKYKLKVFLHRFTRKIIYKIVDAFVAWNKKSVEFMAQMKVSREKIFLGYHFYPLCEYKSEKNKNAKAVNKNKKIVLTISYLLPRKGISYLIDAFKQINDENITLIIGGSGPEESLLKNKAAEDKRILFTGYMTDELKIKYLKQADVFVLPTLWDPWGLIINEAMYFGLPIIVTDAAGCSDYLIKDNGFVIKAGDINALKQAMEVLLRDDKLRIKMGRKSKQLIKERNKIEYTVGPIIEAINYAIKNYKECLK